MVVFDRSSRDCLSAVRACSTCSRADLYRASSTCQAVCLVSWSDSDSSCRASFYLYNTREDVQRLADGLRLVIKKLR